MHAHTHSLCPSCSSGAQRSNLFSLKTRVLSHFNLSQWVQRRRKKSCSVSLRSFALVPPWMFNQIFLILEKGKVKVQGLDREGEVQNKKVRREELSHWSFLEDERKWKGPQQSWTEQRLDFKSSSTTYVIWGKSPTSSAPKFSHLQIGDNHSVCLTRWGWELNQLIYTKYLLSCKYWLLLIIICH